jgi:phage shock protein A
VSGLTVPEARQTPLNAWNKTKGAGMEDSATARAKLNREADLDTQLADLGRDKKVDAKLEEMKRQLGQGRG